MPSLANHMETDSKKNQPTQIGRRRFKPEPNNAANNKAEQWHCGFKNDEEQSWSQWTLTSEAERDGYCQSVETQRQHESNYAREDTRVFTEHGNHFYA